ncbi:MAG: hypothetical protein EOP42_07000 [Sphingobacteriaceae bacterium]|nr:MAG: hypothetical protein EOP42_07000 [Sphingobacteriaceae bacterium]
MFPFWEGEDRSKTGKSKEIKNIFYALFCFGFAVKLLYSFLHYGCGDTVFMRINFTSGFWWKYLVFGLMLIANFNQVKAQTDTLNQPENTPVKEAFLQKFEAYQLSKNYFSLLDIADRNHYPSPQKVLTWQKQLQLNDRQKLVINQINTELKRKVNEMNNFLITNERTMDSLFRYKKINNGMLIYYTNRYGLYQGELRNALLQACVKTEAVLTSTQIKKYNALLQN